MTVDASVDITGMLIDWRRGDQNALNELIPLVESALRRLARIYVRKYEPGDTMQVTALVNEAYIRLVDQTRVNWQSRAHFFAISAICMQRVLLNHARRWQQQKRGGAWIHIPEEDVQLLSKEKSVQILDLEDALKRLRKIDKRKADMVVYRYYGGLTVPEISEVTGVSDITVARDWRFAKAWLYNALRNER